MYAAEMKGWNIDILKKSWEIRMEDKDDFFSEIENDGSKQI